MKDAEALKVRIRKYVSLESFLIKDKIVSLNLNEEQISCPFHGPDMHKSARFYRETDTIYCWTCKKVWDLFSYLMTKNQLSYSEVLNRLIKNFKIPIDDLPNILEGAIKKKIESKTVKYDRKKTILESIQRTLIDLREKIELEKYYRLIFAYMLLKNSTPEKKFEEMATKIVEALMRLKRG